MGGTGTHRQREGGGDALGRLLPGCRNTGSVSARSAISAYQRACKPRVTKSRALICSFHGEVGIDPDAALAALAKSCSRSRAYADSLGTRSLSWSVSRYIQLRCASDRRWNGAGETGPPEGRSRSSARNFASALRIRLSEASRRALSEQLEANRKKWRELRSVLRLVERSHPEAVVRSACRSLGPTR